MTRKCSSCGAAVSDSMKICPNCGRLLSSIGDRHEYQPERQHRARPASAALRQPEKTHQNGRRPAPKQTGGSRRKQPAPQRPAAAGPHTKKRPAPVQEEKELPGWTRIIKRTAVIAVILAAVYFALFGLQVLRIKHSSYEFDTGMKLTASDYGEAFNNSVTGGSWSYNPFTFRMTYSGIHDGKEIAIRFSAAVKLDVESILVGSEEKTEREQIHNYLMGLFI